MDEKIELYKVHVQKQENFAYYLVALSVAAIGYSVHQTFEKEFEYSMIPLGLAVLFWSGSIFLGLRYLKTSISLIYKNMGQFSILEGTHDFIGNNPALKQVGYELLKEMIEKENKRIVFLFLWQGRLFYGGMILYFVWHLYGMYQATH